MDNYNGQNPMGENQNPQQPTQQMQYQQPIQQMQYQQPMQGQYQQQAQQMQYQQPMQGQYQQPMQGQYQQQTYQNGYYTQPNYASQKPKSGGLKWLLIIGIPAFLGMVTLAIILLICFLFPSYDIDDYDDVYDACYDVLDVKLELSKNISSYLEEEGIVSYAYGENDESKYEAGVRWMEFATEDLAEVYYSIYVNDLKEEYDDEKNDCDISAWKSNDTLTEAYLGEDGEVEKVIIIREDEYIMEIWLEGKKSTVQDLTDDILDELD